MVEITYQMLLSTLQTIALIVGIAYYLFIMRNSQRNQELARRSQEHATETRQAQLFMYIYDRWSSREYNTHFFAVRDWEWTDYEDFIEKYGWQNNPDTYYHFSSIGTYFEGIGVLVNRGLVDPTLVDDLISGSVTFFWEKFGESIIKERRRRDNFPQLFEWVEYLYNAIKPIRDSQHPELKT
jgi:hypothetical protein